MRGRTIAGFLFTCLLGASALSMGPADAQESGTGGTLRIGATRFEFDNVLDPTHEYNPLAWGIYSNLLLRTLVTYRHVSGPEGTELVPDLATEVPAPTDDGLTYTFHLKDGIRFGPPVDREITSDDIEYAFARMYCRGCYPAYGFYYRNVIEGMADHPKPNPPRLGSIEGIETPDEDTIVFHLTKPTGDFLHRLALPATGPIPQEAARCLEGPGDYGSILIASGPYMIEGSEELDLSGGCEAKWDGLSIRGWHFLKWLKLVRNPNYDPSTDDPSIRANHVDRVVFRVIDGDIYYLYDKVRRGELDLAVQPPPDEVVRSYEHSPDLRDRLHSDPAERAWYITMNLTRSPFDDIEVRRAVNYAMDKPALREAWGGEVAGEVATHILPPNLTKGHPTSSEYDPYGTVGGSNEEAARAAMARSRYDSDGDGRCDAPVCSDVLFVSRGCVPDEAQSCRYWEGMQPVIVRALETIGIDVEVRRRHRSYGYSWLMNVREAIPISAVPGWQKDHADPCTFICLLFDGRKIRCEYNFNYSLVGATPETKRRCNAPGRFRGLPNVDADIDRCQAILIGPERDECWRELDRKLMEEVVPWVPYLWGNNINITGPAVTKWEYDQFSGQTAFSHVAVDPALQE